MTRPESGMACLEHAFARLAAIGALVLCSLAAGLSVFWMPLLYVAGPLFLAGQASIPAARPSQRAIGPARCRQTLAKARSSPSAPRTTRTGVLPTSATTWSPGPSSWRRWATSCQLRSSTRAWSCASAAAPRQAEFLSDTRLQRRIVAKALAEQLDHETAQVLRLPRIADAADDRPEGDEADDVDHELDRIRQNLDELAEETGQVAAQQSADHAAHIADDIDDLVCHVLQALQDTGEAAEHEVADPATDGASVTTQPFVRPAETALNAVHDSVDDVADRYR